MVDDIDQDRAWMLRTIAEAAAAKPHATTVVWAAPERGMAHFSVQCRTCGQVAIGTDSAQMHRRALEHEREQPNND